MSNIKLTNRYNIKSEIATGNYSSGNLMRFSLHSNHPGDLTDFLDFIMADNDTVIKLSEFFESMNEESDIST